MNFNVDLGSRLSITDIRSLASQAMADVSFCDAMFMAMKSDDYRVASHAAWVLTHLPKEGNAFLASRRDELVRLAVTTPDTPLRRLSLNLLERLDWPEEEVRTDLLDFCLARLVMPAETPGVRALCIKLAWHQCRHYPELADELHRTLLFIESESLKPGLRHTRNKILNMLKKSLVLILLLLVGVAPFRAVAQTDSLVCGYDHSFTPSQLIAPGTLLTAGSVITAVPYLHQNIDFPIRDWAQSYHPPRVYFDDYVQYVPLGSVVVLKACGVKSEHSWRDLVCLTAGSCLVGLGTSRALKYACAVGRPGNPDERTSFPSGHTVTAFLGAEILRREYGEEYPGIAIAGYTVATGVACMRVWNNRHWCSDLLGGAGLAILSVGLTYWLAPYLTF